jgi:hypothetical protein
MFMRSDKEIRDYAARYGFTLRKIPNHGGVKIIDCDGNERICRDMYSADELVRTFREEPLTSPVFEVGNKNDRVRSLIAAKNGVAAKSKFRERNRLHLTTPDAVLTARRVKDS